MTRVILLLAFLFFPFSALFVDGDSQMFSYLSNAPQSYTIPSGTQYLYFVVIGYA